ncbi:testis-specific protein TEX28 [Lissotriton helveticus]
MSDQEGPVPPAGSGSVGAQEAPRGSHPPGHDPELPPPGEHPEAQSDLEGEAPPGPPKSELASSAPSSQDKSIFKRQKEHLRQSFASFNKMSGFFKGSGQSQKEAQRAGSEEEAQRAASEQEEDSGAEENSGAVSRKARVAWAQADSVKSSSWPRHSHGSSSATGSSLPLATPALEWGTARAVEAQLRQKILQLSEQLRVEQSSREENTRAYLQLAAKAELHQSAQVREVFEKRNQRTSATIAQLQHRIQGYQRKLREIEPNQLGRQVSDLELSIESRVASLSDSTLHQTEALSTSLQSHPKGHLSASESALFSVASTSSDSGVDSHNKPSEDKGLLDTQHILSGETVSPQETTKSGIEEHTHPARTFREFLKVLKASHAALEADCKTLKDRYFLDYRLVLESIQSVKHRISELEGQLDDLQEVHQNEISDLKQELAFTEEKMAYQSYENARDVWEVMDTFQSRMLRLETQHATSQQEAMETDSSRQLYHKIVNLFLAIITILLVFVPAVHTCILPFVKTRRRAIASGIVFVACIVLWHHHDSVWNYVWNSRLFCKLDPVLRRFMVTNCTFGNKKALGS